MELLGHKASMPPSDHCKPGPAAIGRLFAREHDRANGSFFLCASTEAQESSLHQIMTHELSGARETLF